MTKRCDFGKCIKIRLVQLDKNQVWLIEQVRQRTGLYFDSSYLAKIITGKLATPSIVNAIRAILDIEEGDEDGGCVRPMEVS